MLLLIGIATSMYLQLQHDSSTTVENKCWTIIPAALHNLHQDSETVIMTVYRQLQRTYGTFHIFITVSIERSASVHAQLLFCC
uniref:Lipocalin n=1 Tax=Rhipicephalus zambeziensis TaxID=60191 RepID=A0A224YFQ5_9ACAR